MYDAPRHWKSWKLPLTTPTELPVIGHRDENGGGGWPAPLVVPEFPMPPSVTHPPRHSKGRGDHSTDLRRVELTKAGPVTLLRRSICSCEFEALHTWTHIIGAVLFLSYGIVRTAAPYHYSEGVSGTMCNVAPFVWSAMFIVSTSYHVSLPNATFSAWMREMDYAFIWITLATLTLADFSVAVMSLPPLRWQSWADPIIPPIAAVTFFLVQRYLTPIMATFHDLRYGPVGSWAAGHTDRFPPVRLGIIAVLTIAWILNVPCLLFEVPPLQGMTVIMTYVTNVLFAGVAKGNDMTQYTDWLCTTPRVRTKSPLGPCHSFGVTSHAIWHIAAIIVAVLATTTRELLLEAQVEA